MTSLAKQLQKLALPQAHSLLSEDKRRASLLFDPKEAANLDRETVFAIGSNGLDELQNIDEAFQEFESSLFNETAQDFERSIQSREVNEQLNQTIADFLVRLSPYFLLKPAHKTLEWLIYRYQIHLFNMDDFIMCILPYHESKIFIRAIQLLKLDDPTTRWNWIQPIQKPGVPLARSTLVTHCSKDPSFRHFICEMVPKFLKIHGKTSSGTSSPLRVVMSFYASTIVGSLAYASKIKESVLSQLLPYLVKGLKSKNVDYKAATYMIVSQLVNKAKLKSTFLDSVLPTLTKNISAHLLDEAVMCLLLIFQTQSITKLPKKSFKHMCKSPGIVQVLYRISMNYKLTPLLRPFLSCLIPVAVKDTVAMTTSSDGGTELSHGPAQYAGLLESLLQDLVLDPALAKEVARSLLDEYMVQRERLADSEDSVVELNMRVREFVRPLEHRYPDSLDAVMADAASRLTSDVERSQLNDFVSLTLSSAKHEILPGSETSLVLGLSHPNAEVRKLAVQHLAASICEDKVIDVDFKREVICDRLRDDNEGVVCAVLELGKRLLDVVGPVELFDHFKRIFAKGRENANDKWTKCCAMAMEVMCSHAFIKDASQDFSDKVFLTLLEALFVSCNEGAMLALVIMKSEFVSCSPMLDNISKEWISHYHNKKAKTTYLGRLNRILVEGIASSLANMEMKERLRFVSLLVDQSSSLINYQVAVVLSMSCLLKRLTTSDGWYSTAIQTLKLLDRISTKVDDDCTPIGDLKTSVDESLLKLCIDKMETSRQCPRQVYDSVLYGMLESLQIPSSLSGKCWWDEDTGDCLVLLTKMFDLLTSGSVCSNPKVASLYKQLLSFFLKEKFTDVVSQLRFLSSLWTHHCKPSSSGSVVLQARALSIAGCILSSDETALTNKALQSLSSVTISLLLAVTSPVSAITEAALGCLATLVNKCGKNCQWLYQPLAAKLLRNREELIADSSYLPQSLAAVFRKACRKTEEVGGKRSNKKDKKFQKKKALMDALDGLLSVVIDSTTPLFVATTLLGQLSLVNSLHVVDTLIPTLGHLLDQVTSGSQPLSPHQRDMMRLILNKFTMETADIFQSSSEALRLFMKCLKTSTGFGSRTESPQLCAIEQVTRDLFRCLPSDALRQDILHLLFDIWVSSEDTLVADAVRKCLKGLSLDANQILVEINRIDQAEKASTVRDVKRIRRNSREVTSTECVVETLPWRRVILILEMLQTKKKLKNIHVLVPVLFSLISKCLEVNDQMSVEYMKQSCLSCIQSICHKLSPNNTPVDEELVSERQFNIELIVQCIRVSDNPQTHRQALLLLSVASGMFPEHVLHNIMSIFTFMGANIMRQDDAYSFQVITRTVETVIPALIVAKSISSQKLEQIVHMVIQVFVDAQPHIPEHRRMPLFSKLVATVGGERFLWMTLVMLLDVFVTKGLHNEGKEHPHLEFCAALCHQFEPAVQIKTARKLLKFLTTLPQDKTDDPKPKTPLKAVKNKGGEERELFDMSTHTSKQLRHFKFTTAGFISSLVSSTTFISQVVELRPEEGRRMQQVYQNLLEQCLQYVSVVARSVEEHNQDVSARFWRALLHKAYDILEKVNSLLPSNVFISVVTGLMENELSNVRRKAMELLNNKLQQHREPYSQEETDMLLGLVDSLVSVATAKSSHGDGEELAVNRQTALYSLKLLCKSLGAGHPQVFKQIIPVAVDTFLSGSAPVSASALLCLAELCLCLKAHAIPHLSRFMPPLLKLLKDEDSLMSNELLWLSAVTTLQKVVESLPHFLSPYLMDIVFVTSCLSTLVEKEDMAQKTHLAMRLKTVRSHLSESLPPRVLLPAVVSCYQMIEKDKTDCISPLTTILSDHIAHLDKTDLSGHHTEMVTFFLTMMDFRGSHPQLKLEVLSKVEGHILNCVLTMVMRLSEASFRPMFLKLYDWASRSDDSKKRLLVFYRLSALISDQLKDLFTLFAGHIVKHAANLLDSLNTCKSGEDEVPEEDQKVVQEKSSLLQHTLDCLHNCFLHDNDGFVNKERFDTLMQPLVDQIENLQGGENVYQDRITSRVIPAIAQFAVAVGDDSLWKPLNYQVCLKTRHSSPKVRFASLKVIEAFSAKLGEDYMTLLPETIPFLAELMEDESFEVEQECQHVISELEKVLGEPLQKYF